MKVKVEISESFITVMITVKGDPEQSESRNKINIASSTR